MRASDSAERKGRWSWRMRSRGFPLTAGCSGQGKRQSSAEKSMKLRIMVVIQTAGKALRRSIRRSIRKSFRAQLASPRSWWTLPRDTTVAAAPSELNDRWQITKYYGNWWLQVVTGARGKARATKVVAAVYILVRMAPHGVPFGWQCFG